MPIDTLESAHAWMAQHAGAEPRRFSTVNRWQPDPTGRSASIVAIRDVDSGSCVLPVNEALTQLLRMRPLLRNGLVAYVGYGIEDPSTFRHDELAVKELSSPIDIVRQMGTEAGNYDLTTDDVVRALERLLGRYPLEILGAGIDACLLRCTDRVWWPARLAREIDELCPDCVSQDLGSMNALTQCIRRQEPFRLWWD